MEPVVSDMPAFLGIRNEAARQEGSTGVVSLWLKVLVVPEDAAGGGLYPNSRCVEGYLKVGMHLFLTISSCRIVEPSSNLCAYFIQARYCACMSMHLQW